MRRVVEKGKLPDNLRNELFSWESILCGEEGLSLPTALGRIYAFFEKKLDILIAVQKADLLALANSAESRFKMDIFALLRNVWWRKESSQRSMREELFMWEGILCEDSLPLPAAVKRIVTFFEKNQDKLIAVQKGNLLALANSTESNRLIQSGSFFVILCGGWWRKGESEEGIVYMGRNCEGKMEGVGRLWSQHIALNEPLRTQTCKTNLYEPPLRLRTAETLFRTPNTKLTNHGRGLQTRPG